MNEQQTETQPSLAWQWLVFFGAVIAVVGTFVLAIAHSKKAAAERVLEFTNSTRVTPALQHAMTAQSVGLGVLVFGLALLLCGIAVAAVKR